MIWCIVALASSLESNQPKMCFPERETCQAIAAALYPDPAKPAQCIQRVAKRATQFEQGS